MDTKMFALTPRNHASSQDTLFDIELSEAAAFVLRMKAAGNYLVKMNAPLDRVMKRFGIDYNDISRFERDHPEFVARTFDQCIQKAAY